MSRYLTVTCTAPRCDSEGRALFRGVEIESLPAGWLIVSHEYGPPGFEFCSLDCLIRWAEGIKTAQAKTREWANRPKREKPKTIDTTPERGLL